MFKLELRTKGEKQVAKDMKPGVKKELAEGLKKLTMDVLATVKKATVVDTGVLRSSMAHELRKDYARVGTVVQYAEFVEFGTQKMEARHMEGGTKVLGEGMMAYTLRIMKDRFKQFRTELIRDVKKRNKGI